MLREKSKLKEIYIVRYADDFKIFCRDYGTAKKTYTAVVKWLKERLSLEISEEKSGVTLVSHKENIDTDTPAGKFMLTVFAALSQLEREQLKQRQREGIEIAKAQGKYTGRKPIPIDWMKFGQLYGEWKPRTLQAEILCGEWA